LFEPENYGVNNLCDVFPFDDSRLYVGLHNSIPFTETFTDRQVLKDQGLNESLLASITTTRLETRQLYSQQAIPVLVNSGTKDFIGLAAHTGYRPKPAAFGMPLLQWLPQQTGLRRLRMFVLPRELCIQIVNEIELFKKQVRGIHVVAVYGGTSIGMQIKDIKKGVQLVVATPGRLIDLIERKAINLEQIKYVVLDEADEMLNMGFQEDIEFILQNTPNREATWLFSATMPPEIRKVSRRYMKEPFEVTVGKANTGNKNIDHQYFVTSAQHRYETLKALNRFQSRYLWFDIHPHQSRCAGDR
jgi:ATP-dependent RNA helicase DeaD